MTSKEETSVSKPIAKYASEDLRQKFQALQERRKQISQKATKKMPKHLKRGTVEKVSEVQNVESEEVINDRSMLPEASRKRCIETDPIRNREHKHDSSIDLSEEAVKKWQEIRSYLGINDHISHVDKGKYAPKCGLEEQIDKAISSGQYSKAEQLSDHLADREFGEKIAGAIDAVQFAQKKKREEDIAEFRKKRKLAWGFDHKQKWETKSNM